MTTETTHRKTYPDVPAANSGAGVGLAFGMILGLAAALDVITLPGLENHLHAWGSNAALAGMAGLILGGIVGAIIDTITWRRSDH